MPRETGFQSFTDQSSGVGQGLADSTRPPVRRYDVNRILKQYKLGSVKTKGKSDKALFNVARKAVIDWFERQQKAKAAAKKKRQQARKTARQQTRRFNRAIEQVNRAASQPQTPTAPARPRRATQPAPAPRRTVGTRSPGGHFIP